MKSITYSGFLHIGSFNLLLIDDIPLASLIQDDWEYGSSVSFRYYITDRKVRPEQAVDALIRKMYGGEIEVEYVLEAYSEITVEECTEHCKIGNHDLIKILTSFEGKYATIIMESELCKE